MAMQGISPSGEKKIIEVSTIAGGADTTVCMMGGRFCVFTAVAAPNGKLSGNVTIKLCCGGENTNYLPTSSNKDVTISVATDDTVACTAVDMGGYQSFKIKSVTGMSNGMSIIIEPMWC